MKRVKSWIKHINIRQKFVIYTYLIITPILIVISTLLFFNNYRTAIRDEENACIQNVQSLSDSIEACQKTMMELGTYITINTDINEILTVEDPEELNKDGQLWIHNAPMRMLLDVIAINGEIKTVAIYPENGVTPYLRCLDATSHVTELANIKESDVYNQAIENKGRIIWGRVGKQPSDIYSTNRTDKIVLYREIYDLSKRNKLGFLAIGASAQKFDSICENSLRSNNEEIIVMSKGQAELVRCGGMEDETIRQIMEQEATNVNADDKNPCKHYAQYNVYKWRNENTGTTIYKIVPKMGLRDVVKSILIMPLSLLGGFLIGLYPILIFVSNVVSKPLKKLTQAMHEFKKGDFSQKVDVNTYDEVGEASACFNEMVGDMKQLIDKNYVMALRERESELDALQAQINPHFLYNALDSLYWQTLEAGNEDIAENILALSDIFRLVLSRGEGIVTVRNEQELLERYLQIQKMRFNSRMDYRITIDEDIMEAKIPKLILQPFVENAIVHGFEKTQTHFYLSVVGRKDKDYLNFYIEDTGVGMSAEQIEEIWNQENSGNYSGQRIGKYAIKNVKERLELKYHGNFELRIESEKGHGTMVNIRIPFED